MENFYLNTCNRVGVKSCKTNLSGKILFKNGKIKKFKICTLVKFCYTIMITFGKMGTEEMEIIQRYDKKPIFKKNGKRIRVIKEMTLWADTNSPFCFVLPEDMRGYQLKFVF